MGQELTKQERYFIFIIGLVLAGVVVVIFAWNWKGGTDFYSRSYAPVVQRSQEQRRLLDELDKKVRSSQPRPAGFKESEIEKTRGDRYSTY